MQVQYSAKDLVEFEKEHKNCITRLQNLKKDGDKAKAEIIRKMIEINMPLIDSGKINGFSKREELAIYLWEQLDKYNIAEPFIHYSWFIEQFPDNLKRKYSKSTDTDFLKAGVLKGGEIIEKSLDQKEIKIGNKIYKQVDIETNDEKIKKMKQTIAVKDTKSKKSIALECIVSSRDFLTVFDGFLDKFERKLLEDPKILNDFENSLEFQELYDMCGKLVELYDPPSAKKLYDKTDPNDEGSASILNQMMDELNFRAPATIFQKAMAKTLQILISYRQWAHRMAISPRQYQRVRQRLGDWPEKKASVIIHNVLGSHICPCGCRYNLISKRKVPKDPIETELAGEKYIIPKEYRKFGINPIEVCAAIFSGKIRKKS